MIALTKQVDRNSLWMVNQDLKEKLRNIEIASCQWILTYLMVVDALAKKMDMHKDLKEVFMEGHFKLKNEEINKVLYSVI